MSQIDYPKYGTTYAHVSVAFPDEDTGEYDNSFGTFIKTTSDYTGGAEDDLVHYYGMDLDEIEYAYLNQVPYEEGWIITGIDYATDELS